MKKILIFHPEGNVTNNPNLSSIVELLSEWYEIYLFQPRRTSIYQEIIWKNVHSVFYETQEISFLEKGVLKKELDTDYDLIIATDKGIEYAKKIAHKKKIPFGLISYEIFFPKTYQQRLDKRKEKNACKDASFAISQDAIRAYLLSVENNIPIEKIMNIPVSGSYTGPYNKSVYLQQKLGIPEEKKIVLYIGSVSSWALSDKIIDTVSSWPESWVLVIHPRYGVDESVKSKIGNRSNGRIYLSTEPVHQVAELEKIICSADVGLASYTYDLSSPLVGENLLFMGLSSGKIASYLKYEIPVIINNGTTAADIILNYGLGKVVCNMEDISLDVFTDDYLRQTKANCKKFFLEYLDFSLYKDTVLLIIRDIIDGKDVVDIIKKSNQLFEMKNINSLMMLELYKNMRKIKNNLTYDLQKNLLYKIKRIRHKIINLFYPPPPIN